MAILSYVEAGQHVIGGLNTYDTIWGIPMALILQKINNIG